LRITPSPPPTLREIAARRRPGDVFAPAGTSEASRMPVPPVQPSTSVELLVMLASGEDEVERRRRMAEPAERGLAALEALDAEVRTGETNPQSLQRLAAWASEAERPDDPELCRLLKEIELRALVELAKQERDAGGE
jgi:hypothetical protein